jgi:hypothetical protein
VKAPRGVLLGAAALALASTGALATAPADGQYDGTLCVTVAAAAASCGTAEVGLRADSLARVRVSDITFQLWLYPSRVSVVVMHGGMQIHEFESGYAWQGPSLQFADTAKNTRYEVRLGERKP